MASASLRYGSGPGSSLALSAETVRTRNKVIEAFIDKPLSELTSFLNTALDAEPDEERRLGMIAARVYILRHRIDNVRAYNKDATIEPLVEPTPRSMLRPHSESESGDTAEINSEDSQTESGAGWQEVEIIEAGEINGVRIPAGISIKVDSEDAERLISSGKAVLKTSDEDTAGDESLASDSAEPEPLQAEGTDNGATDAGATDAGATDAGVSDAGARLSEADTPEPAEPSMDDDTEDNQPDTQPKESS